MKLALVTICNLLMISSSANAMTIAQSCGDYKKDIKTGNLEYCSYQRVLPCDCGDGYKDTEKAEEDVEGERYIV